MVHQKQLAQPPATARTPRYTRPKLRPSDIDFKQTAPVLKFELGVDSLVPTRLDSGVHTTHKFYAHTGLAGCGGAILRVYQVLVVGQLTHGLYLDKPRITAQRLERAASVISAMHVSCCASKPLPDGLAINRSWVLVLS